MDRIRNPGVEDDPRRFLDDNELPDVPATPLDSRWLSMLQEELCQCIEAAGLTLSDQDNTQLLTALAILVSQHPMPAHQHDVSDLIFSEHGVPGTYGLMTMQQSVGMSYEPGASINGSLLSYASAAGISNDGSTVPGNWVCLGYVSGTNGGTPSGTTLFYRRY